MKKTKEVVNVDSSSKENTNIENKISNKIYTNPWFYIALIIVLVFCLFIFILKPNLKYILLGTLDIKAITIENYNKEDNSVKITINTTSTIMDNEVMCYLSVDNAISDDDKVISIKNNTCTVTAELYDYYIILENKNKNIVNTKKITDYVNKSLCIETSYDKLYLAIGAEQNVSTSLISIGKIESSLKWTSADNNIALVNKGKITGIANGATNIVVSDLYGNEKSINVIVTDLIDNYILSEDKPLLKGEIYTLEEANLLDEILEARVNAAGYSTRAGAVAAARFLTLEFPYSIPYFYENGRLNSSGINYADGEGRYYHKGLYLHKSKMEFIEASFVGPAIWGMPLTNFDKDENYIVGRKYPNGLDCSGFVSWAILNGRI